MKQSPRHRRPLAAVLFAAALLGLAAPALAQNVPPLQTPDVTTLLAPGGGDSSSVPTPNSDSGGTGSAGAAAPSEAPAPDTADAAPAAPCGAAPISIARMTWPSAALLAEIHARLLKAQFDCTVQVLPSDLAPAVTGMAATGQPAVAPEMWLSRVAVPWNQAVKDQKLRQVGPSYVASGFEGWYVPDYIATAHPELKSVAAVKDNIKLFAAGGEKARFISCPPDWACAIINRNLLKAEGLDQFFTIAEPKNRFDLDQTIAEAVGRKEPILFYYWEPNAAPAQLDFKPLDLGPYNADAFTCLAKRACAEPKPSSFAPEPVVTALAEWVFTGAPEVAAYFQRAQMPMPIMDGLLAQLNVTGATVESVADKFVADRQDIWGKWVGLAPAAAPAAATPTKPAVAARPVAAAPRAVPAQSP